MKQSGATVSRVARAASGNRSLRTTIPQQIARSLGISAGDLLRWETGKGGTVTVRKLD